METLQSVSWPNLFSVPWLPTAFLTVAIAVLTLLVVHQWGAAKKKGDHRELPGPRPWPIIGNFPLLGQFPHKDLLKLAKHYGPIFRLYLGAKPVIVVTSPEMAEEVLKTHDSVLSSRPRLSQFKIMGYDNQTLTTAPIGPFWRYARKVFTQELLTNKRIQDFRSVRKEEALMGLHSLLKQCEEGRMAGLRSMLQNYSLNIVTRMVMKKSFYGSNPTATSLKEAATIRETHEELIKVSGMFVPGDYIPLLAPFDIMGIQKQMRAIVEKNDTFYQQIVDEHRERLRAPQQDNEKEVMDLVDVLLTRQTAVDENALTDLQIKGILQDVVIAGGDTTTITLEWAMSELLRHPKILKKAQEELDNIVGRDRLVEETDSPNLTYISWIVRETLRLHPPAPLGIPHESMEECEIAGFIIPSKTLLFVNAYAIMRDPKIWERSLEFFPDRFSSSNIDIQGQDFKALPFGFGRRACPGKALALLEVNYMLSILLQACDWAPPPGVRPEDVDVEEAPGFQFNHKNIPFQGVATPRLPSHVIYGDRK